MKTPKEWLNELSSLGFNHPAACICDRCKSGHETFLLESDIADIQRDALKSALPIIEKVGTTGIEHAYPQAKAWLENHFPEYL